MFPWNQPYNKARSHFNERVHAQPPAVRNIFAQAGAQISASKQNIFYDANIPVQGNNAISGRKDTEPTVCATRNAKYAEKAALQRPSYEIDNKRRNSKILPDQPASHRSVESNDNKGGNSDRKISPRPEHQHHKQAENHGQVKPSPPKEQKYRNEFEVPIQTPRKARYQPPQKTYQPNVSDPNDLEPQYSHPYSILHPPQYGQPAVTPNNQQNYAQMGYGTPVQANKHIDYQDERSMPQSRTQVRNKHNDMLMKKMPSYPQTDQKTARQERIEKYSKYQQDLLEQIEEKKRRKAAEAEKEKLEYQRIQTEMAEMNQRNHSNVYQRRLLFESGQKQAQEIQASQIKNNDYDKTDGKQEQEPDLRIKLPSIQISQEEAIVQPLVPVQPGHVIEEGLNHLKMQWKDYNLNIQEQLLEVKKGILDIQEQRLKSQQEINEVKLQLQNYKDNENMEKAIQEEVIIQQNQQPPQSTPKEQKINVNVRARKFKHLKPPQSLQNLELSRITPQKSPKENYIKSENVLDLSSNFEISEPSFMYSKTSSIFQGVELVSPIMEIQTKEMGNLTNNEIKGEFLTVCNSTNGQEEIDSVDTIIRKTDKRLEFLEELETMGLA